MGQGGTILSYEDFISHVVEKLLDIGQSALIAHSKFENYVNEQVGKALAKVVETLEKLKIQVTDAIRAVVNKIPGVQSVKACIAEKKSKADVLFSNAVNKGQDCINNRRQKSLELLNYINNITANAQHYASLSKEDAEKCTETSNFFKIGVCFAKLAAKVAKFASKTKYWLGRIKLHMLTLPASLGFCAGTGLANAGTNTARIVFEIGLCTSSKIHDYLTGYPAPPDNNPETLIVPLKMTTDVNPSTVTNQLDGDTTLSNRTVFNFERKLE